LRATDLPRLHDAVDSRGTRDDEISTHLSLLIGRVVYLHQAEIELLPRSLTGKSVTVLTSGEMTLLQISINRVGYVVRPKTHVSLVTARQNQGKSAIRVGDRQVLVGPSGNWLEVAVSETGAVFVNWNENVEGRSTVVAIKLKVTLYFEPQHRKFAIVNGSSDRKPPLNPISLEDTDPRLLIAHVRGVANPDGWVWPSRVKVV